MPGKISDNRTTTAESLHAVEEETAAGARRIVATYSRDFLDGVTLMCMLGVEPSGLRYSKVSAEHEESQPKKAAKRTRKAPAKKAAKKTTAKKTTKKTTAKKTTKKS
ncbi:hypothetical protein [Corynebacterium pacaense]|uniref:hypothetical protein n=1 Tax=Corynebacterium pacaense TaxID=1816684 RepID=UPI0009BB57F2|nr:hypothetical protein [Corynebacterium pacaense]